MHVLHWKQLDWSGREFGLRSPEHTVGKLAFESWTGFDATYTSEKVTIQFRNRGWFEQDVTIVYNGEEIGQARASLFGKTTVQLRTGETYTLKSEAFSYNRTVQDATGHTIISFKQPTFSFGKGEIGVADSVSELSREVLVSTSLYLKAVSEHQAAILIIVFIPIFLRNILD
ncbi:hypothetical protein H7F15_07925 [Pontibacter sp. Tf4]|uniref:hypothetical protein n=1 Tax=Pontibacter sp. Tf4 TaxID=2761620 RepID=UPI001629CCEF|nr:hypothetical protein [Pontibacter sp. Tf4]MBB6610960.1 hypothetical protein [Pontibacter sp. Tf4]